MASSIKLPPDQDLRRLIQFMPEDGRIWLAGHRMVLLHVAALGELRRELIETIGREQTRRLLLRTGYAAGERDATLARKIRSGADFFAMFAVGVQLHMLEGAVQVTPEHFTADPATGHFHGVFRWDHSWEAETHLRHFGSQKEPVCWMLLGYASGYTSGFMGRPVLYKEVACCACGDSICRVEGRNVEDWPDGESLLQEYQADSLIVRLEDLHAQVERFRALFRQEPADDLGPLVGQSPAFQSALSLLRRAAATKVTVLLTGETGVGKERFARTLHALSERREKPFVAVNCAALPADLVESELFGSEKGAYTGATESRPGRFERADGGTLFLDEIGELPLPVQAKLLRVLQYGEVDRLGSTVTRKVDVRLVAATNVDLEEAVTAGRFRRDLFYRLNVFPISIPPLRERLEDIEPLANFLLQKFALQHGKRVAGFTDRALEAMRRYPWPGNIRELENLVERGVILANPGSLVDVDQLFPTLVAEEAVVVDARGLLDRAPCADAAALYEEVIRRGLSLEALEGALIQEAVARANGNLSAAARALGMTRPQLSYRLKRLQETE